MNNFELEKCLRQNPYTRKIFIGVFPSNRIPKKPINIRTDNDKIGFIANVSDDTHPGSHWISFVITKTTIEYFDSGGKSYTKNKYFKTFVKINSIKKKIIFNKLKIQSEFSDSCGQYSALFLLARAKNIDPLLFFNFFKTKDLIENDFLAYSMFKRYFKCKTENYDNQVSIPYVKYRQSCKSKYECNNKII